MSAIGELAVSIIGNTRGIKASFKETKREVKGLRGRFDNLKGSVVKAGKVLGAGLVAGITAAGAAAVKATKDTLEYADTIDKTSQRMGLSKESTQEWKYVAEQMGTSLDSLERGMTRFQKRVGEADDGLSSAQRAFKNLDIEIESSDGSLRSMDSLMPETIKKLQSMEDTTKRNQLAMELFGRGGKELIPILNSSSGSVDELTQKAHDLGLVMSEDNIDAGVKLKDTLHSLKSAFSGLVREVGIELMPEIQNFADYILENMPVISEVVGGSIGVAIAVLKTLGQSTIDIANIAKQNFDLMVSEVEFLALGFQLNFEKIKVDALSMVNYVLKKLDKLKEVPYIGEKFKGLADSISESAEKSKGKVKELKKAFEDQSEDMKQKSKDSTKAYKKFGTNVADNIKKIVKETKDLVGGTKKALKEQAKTTKSEQKKQTDATKDGNEEREKSTKKSEQEQTDTVKKEAKKRTEARKKEVEKAKEASREIRIFKRKDGSKFATDDPSQLKPGEKWEEGRVLAGTGKSADAEKTTTQSKKDIKNKWAKPLIEQSKKLLESMKKNIKKITDKIQAYTKSSLKTLNSINKLAQKQTNSLQSIDQKLNKLDSILTALNNLNIDITNQYYNGANQESSSQGGSISEKLKDRGVGGSHL